MIPSWALKVLPYAVVGALCGALAWGVNGYRLNAQISELKTAYADEKRESAEANDKARQKLMEENAGLNSRLANLDQSSTEKLTNAQQENDRLQRLYSSADDERRRLRIEVRVARADLAVSATPGAGSVGNAASLELSPEAGSAVWDIRRGMTEDAEKIAYLQGYICQKWPDFPSCKK